MSAAGLLALLQVYMSDKIRKEWSRSAKLLGDAAQYAGMDAFYNLKK